MPSQNELVGQWEKTSRDPCGASYPQTLQFLPDGTYRGAAAAPGEFVVWDVGTYRVTKPDTVELSTANDAVVAYRFTLAGDRLTVTDEGGCALVFQRG